MYSIHDIMTLFTSDYRMRIHNILRVQGIQYSLRGIYTSIYSLARDIILYYNYTFGGYNYIYSYRGRGGTNV